MNRKQLDRFFTRSAPGADVGMAMLKSGNEVVTLAMEAGDYVIRHIADIGSDEFATYHTGDAREVLAYLVGLDNMDRSLADEHLSEFVHRDGFAFGRDHIINPFVDDGFDWIGSEADGVIHLSDPRRRYGEHYERWLQQLEKAADLIELNHFA